MSTAAAYDDPFEIEAKYLTDLEGLNRFIEDRHAAGYERHERLGEFIILGRWHTDSCGNFGDVRFLQSNYRPMDAPPSMPKAIRADARSSYGLHQMETNMMVSCVPKARVLCQECGNGWTLDTAHDSRVTTDHEVLSIGEKYAGRVLAAVHDDLQDRTDGDWFVPHRSDVRNDLYCNEKRATERGWLREQANLDEYVVEGGDEVLAYVRRYTHKLCWERRTRRRTREQFTEIFAKAGWSAELMETPNGYCDCHLCGPWFIAETPAGKVVAGWRKRVINIDWSDTGVALYGLFDSEEVTKGAHYIHAWGADKAVEYLTRLRGPLTEGSR